MAEPSRAYLEAQGCGFYPCLIRVLVFTSSNTDDFCCRPRMRQQSTDKTKKGNPPLEQVKQFKTREIILSFWRGAEGGRVGRGTKPKFAYFPGIVMFYHFVVVFVGAGRGGREGE